MEMMDRFSMRTDLALEEKERFESDNVEVPGVVLEEDYDNEREIRITRVKIETENGAKTMGKPVGTYITLEAPDLAVPDKFYGREVSEKLTEYIEELMRGIGIPLRDDLSVLVAGLGNRKVTPDCLGPKVVDKLCVTRHVIREYGKYAAEAEGEVSVSAITPGVMGDTGMETAEIIRGVVKEAGPDLVIAVDALAARNSRRLNRTIQLADTGIHPGSGVGNNRDALNAQTVGVPVISIGIPTVVDAATIVSDAVENFLKDLREVYPVKEFALSPHLNGMFVTPREVDIMTEQLSSVIADALNLMFSPGRYE